MKINLTNILLITSVILTFIAGITTKVNYSKNVEKTQKINDATNLLLQTIELRSLVKDAETGQRGYLLPSAVKHNPNSRCLNMRLIFITLQVHH